MNSVECPKCKCRHGLYSLNRKFWVGQPVQGRTDIRVSWFVKTYGGVLGTVVGFSRHGDLIRVLINGRKTASTYWPGFWGSAE